EGSQLIAFLLGAKPGEAVVDFCAGAGGKTLAIAAQMNNKGRVVACDISDKRLSNARTRFTRAGLNNIQTRVLSSENDKWVKRSAGTFDRVLVDAPCSGTGVWRRNPDARWKNLGPTLDELLTLQGSILRSAARLVKPGGTLVYATCSLLPDENQMQVEKFLAAHPDFTLVPIAEAWQTAMAVPLAPSITGEMMALTPGRHETDGFFAAVMIRK
ncbi:MAG TPA: rRNA cytosine-C5-methylase, partial [Rhodospirillaceae bacterium]|nr:rRNA cytosine-C5-methylase [Rhodospirillaceae bacterium]